MGRKEDIEQSIRESYEIIHGYERIVQTSNRPEEKLRARRIIREQRELIVGYQAELDALVRDRPLEKVARPVGEEAAGKHVFISYSRKDKAYARRLERDLRSHGLEVWIDERIDYGTTWPHVLEGQVDACAAFLLIMTPRSWSSDWVQNELARAQDKKKPIFPLLLEGDIWLAVQATQYVDVRGGKLPTKRFYERLKKVVLELSSSTK
jgi:hypothetical protein